MRQKGREINSLIQYIRSFINDGHCFISTLICAIKNHVQTSAGISSYFFFLSQIKCMSIVMEGHRIEQKIYILPSQEVTY